MLGVSVVICTYNGVQRLRPTLEHVIAQKAPDSIQWEVIVVDNNSTDTTAEFCECILSASPVKIMWRIVQEKIPGLSAARKAGVLSSSFDIVVFCDDDNWLCDTYVIGVFNFFKEYVWLGVLGGYGKPVFEIDKPNWFDKFERTYAVGKQNNDEDFGAGVFYGASVAVRRDILLEIYRKGFNSLLTDRKGNDLVSGGDNELFLWYQIAGYKLYSSQKLIFYHFIPKDRLTESYLIKRAVAKGKTEAILNIYVSKAHGKIKIKWLENRVFYFAYTIRMLIEAIIVKLKSRNLENVLFYKSRSAAAWYRMANYSNLKRLELQIDNLVSAVKYMKK